MNLNKLMTIQADLDKHIEQKKGLEGHDLLDKKILALQVELGELANEWRGFKFWSEDQESRGYNLYTEGNGVEQKNPLLEEYVDCLHFILSIGLELNINIESLKEHCKPKKMLDTTDHFLWTNKKLLDLYENIRDRNSSKVGLLYLNLFNSLVGLGELLGFTTEQIEQAYLDKNKVNHARQESGY
ncbi:MULTISPECIES: dUTP diphosphatase [unclassified Oceanobacillus]|uniref:dUTP diphosphatase n=1 Tax=unclassified Oceanobacillus TaxID=2630292 RepID=UPI001BECD4D1|nr:MULTISPECIES: dUTP diphosphatase [unclassified Oceanobacillus]MBT2600964.1 dUTP diphosphatase [Oceanobacillus sp. ISL-74]MBT2653585.1 dUTP diphosphatase [Oceanobacillus sp. ISL-73]